MSSTSSYFFPRLNTTPTGLIFRSLFVFMINDHSAEITVKCIFQKDIAALASSQKNSIRQTPSSMLKGYKTKITYDASPSVWEE